MSVNRQQGSVYVQKEVARSMTSAQKNALRRWGRYLRRANHGNKSRDWLLVYLRRDTSQ